MGVGKEKSGLGQETTVMFLTWVGTGAGPRPARGRCVLLSIVVHTLIVIEEDLRKKKEDMDTTALPASCNDRS